VLCISACTEDPEVIEETHSHLDAKAAARAASRLLPCRALAQAAVAQAAVIHLAVSPGEYTRGREPDSGRACPQPRIRDHPQW